MKKKFYKAAVFAVCTLMTASMLCACGKEKKEKTEESDGFYWDTEDVTEDAPAADEDAMLGRDEGFIFDLPSGFAFDDGWGCFSNNTYTMQIWGKDATFYTSKSDFESGISGTDGNSKSAAAGAYKVTMVEQPESFYGAATQYFIDFNGAFDGYYGVRVMVSNNQGDLASTQGQEFLDAFATIRKSDGQGESEPEDNTPYSPVSDLFVYFSGEETARMSNYANSGYSYISDGVLYGMEFTDEDSYLFGMMDVDGASTSNLLAIEMYIQPSFICEHDGYIYFVYTNSGIFRCTKDGENVEKVVDEGKDYLSICGNYAYFTDIDYRYYRVDLDTGEKELLIDREVYFPYPLSDEWVLFQDDADNESLHLLHIPTGTDVALTDEPSYMPIISGSDLFYTVRINDEAHLAKLDLGNITVTYDELSGTFSYDFDIRISDKVINKRLAIDEYGTIYSGSREGVSVNDWGELENTNSDIAEAYVYFDEDYAIYMTYDAEGYLYEQYLEDSFSGDVCQIPRY